MSKRPETRQMEVAVELLASSNRKNFWTKEDVRGAFLKGNKAKKAELEALSELDRRVQAEMVTPGMARIMAPGGEIFGHVHRDRELTRLSQVAARVMREWKEEEYGLHRRFGAFQATPTNGKSEWRWFEVRYCTVSFLQMWRDMKDELKTRIGITVGETDVILDLARERQASSVNGIYRDAMRTIAERRSA